MQLVRSPVQSVVEPLISMRAARPEWLPVGASLHLDYANNRGFTLGSGIALPTSLITFTRATSRTYTNSAGLLAKSTYNLLTYSEDISNAAYSKLAVSITANTTTAPDGTVTADKMAEDATLSTHKIQQSVNTTNTNPHCFSVYVKAAENTFCVILLQETVTFLRYSFVVVNLSAGTISATTDSGGAASTASIAPVGGGWYRVSLVSTLGGVNPAMLAQVFNGNGVTSYTGVAGNGIYIWGAQLEASPAAGPYWATTTAANGAPAIDYDPVTLACKGLLIEEARTNLVLNSATLSTQSVTVAAVAHTLTFYGTGTVTLSGVSTAGPLVGTGAYPNRVSLTFTPTAGSLTLTVSGSVTSAQLEAGSFATSYIPTVASQVTRAADVAVMTGSNFSSWYNQTEGTFVVQFASNSPLTAAESVAANRYPNLIAVDDGASDTFLQIYGVGAEVYVGGTYNNIGTIPAGTNKIAFTATTTAAQALTSLNGAAAVSRTGALPGTATKFAIGSAPGSGAGQFFNGCIRRITYYPVKLPSATLVALSA